MLAAILAVSLYSAAGDTIGFDASGKRSVVIDPASGQPVPAAKFAKQHKHDAPSPALSKTEATGKTEGKTISVHVPGTPSSSSNASPATPTKPERACAVLTGTGTYFTVPTKIGMPNGNDSPQVFDVVADTGSDNVIIPDCQCEMASLEALLSGQRACSQRCFRRPNRTDTSFSLMTDGHKGQLSIDQSFGSGNIESLLASDIVTVGNLSQRLNQSLLLMVKSQLRLDGDANFQGILGLGLPKLAAEQAQIGDTGRTLDMKGFLHAAGVSRFSICASEVHTGAQPKITGALRMFTQNDADAGSKVKMLQSTGTSHWEVGFGGFKVEGGSAIGAGGKAIPDSGTTLILGPVHHLKVVFNQIWDHICPAGANHGDADKSAACNDSGIKQSCGAAAHDCCTTGTQCPPAQQGCCGHHALMHLLEKHCDRLNLLHDLPKLSFSFHDGSETRDLELEGPDYIFDAVPSRANEVKLHLAGLYAEPEPTGHADSGKKEQGGSQHQPQPARVCAPAFGAHSNMPMENMVHNYGGTSKKSTLTDERVIIFAREDEASPRQDILQKECPAALGDFRTCMVANGNDENKCLGPKGILDKCAGLAFKMVNSAPADQWVY